MSIRKESVDLFGGLSDSDTDSEEAQCSQEPASHVFEVLKDLAMSSGESDAEAANEDSNHEHQVPENSWVNVTEKQEDTELLRKQEVTNPEHTPHANFSEDSESNSVPMESTDPTSSFQRTSSFPNRNGNKRKLQNRTFSLSDAPKRTNHEDFKNALLDLEEDPMEDEYNEIIIEETQKTLEEFANIPTYQNVVVKKEPLYEDYDSQQSSGATSTIDKESVDYAKEEEEPLEQENEKPHDVSYETLTQRILSENTDEFRRLREMILLANLSGEQLDRYEVYRRCKFSRQAFRHLIAQHTGTPPSDALVTTIRSLTKMFVGDIVEEAVELRARCNQEDKPIQPGHIKQVFLTLTKQGKLWPPYGNKDGS